MVQSKLGYCSQFFYFFELLNQCIQSKILHVLKGRTTFKYKSYLTKHNIAYINNQAMRHGFRDSQLLFPLLPVLIQRYRIDSNFHSQLSQLKKKSNSSNLNYYYSKKAAYFEHNALVKHSNIVDNKYRTCQMYRLYLSMRKINKFKNKKTLFFSNNRRFKNNIYYSNKGGKKQIFNKYKKSIRLFLRSNSPDMIGNKKINNLSVFNANFRSNIRGQFMRIGMCKYLSNKNSRYFRSKVSSFFLNKYLQRIKFKYISSSYLGFTKKTINRRLHSIIPCRRHALLFNSSFTKFHLYLMLNIIFFVFDTSFCALYLSFLCSYIYIELIILNIINLYQNKKYSNNVNRAVLNKHDSGLSNVIDNMPLILWHIIFKNIFFYSIINQFMKFGKKEKMECIFFDILTIIKRKLHVQPMIFIFKLFNSLLPIFDIYHIRRYRKMHPIPRLLRLRRKLFVLFFMLKQVLREKKKIWYFRNRFVMELIKTNFKCSSIFLKILNLQRFAYNVRRNSYFIRKVKRRTKVFI